MTGRAISALLIEDNPLDARLLREYLSEVTSTRVALECADRLSAGLQRLHDAPPDVLLLDLGLPESQGLDTLFKVLGETPSAPVIVITGLDDEELGYQAVAQGAQDYLVKGRVDGPLLLRSMRHAIERRRAEEALAGERDRAQGYLDVAGVMLLAIDTDHRVTLVNRKGCEILGCEETEIIGKNWFDSFIPEGLRNGVKAIFNQLVAGQIEQAEYFENPVLTSSGEERVIAWHNSVLTDSQGNVTGILSSGEDITERKRSQEEIKQRARQLALVNRIGQRIAPILDLNQLYQAVVEAVQEELGYQNVALFSVQDEQVVLDVVAGPQERLMPLGHTQHITEGMVGWVAQTGKTLLANDVSKEPRFLRLESIEVAAELDVPIQLDGQTIGVLLADSNTVGVFSDADVATLETVAHEVALAIHNATLYQDAQRELAERKRAEEALQQSVDHLQRTLEQTVYALAATVEMRDLYTAGHQRRVANLAYAVAREMGLPTDQARGVYMAGLVHDIGKIQIPAEILSKPTPLTEVEWNLIEVHPQMGYDILNGIEFPWPVAQIVLQHHERLDGSGYPRGLFGESIVLEARILAVADVVEAMSSHRPYRPAHTLTEALEEIRAKRATLYEPHAVDACLKVVAEKASDLGLALSQAHTVGCHGSRLQEDDPQAP